MSHLVRTLVILASWLHSNTQHNDVALALIRVWGNTKRSRYKIESFLRNHRSFSAVRISIFSLQAKPGRKLHRFEPRAPAWVLNGNMKNIWHISLKIWLFSPFHSIQFGNNLMKTYLSLNITSMILWTYIWKSHYSVNIKIQSYQLFTLW